MDKWYLLVSLCFILAFTKDSNPKYPQDAFVSPVKNALFLSGTFGELRPNHLHSGIDIKGKVGNTIVSIADGYISRIKVQSGGYGNVLYISHPNGYTSVYAHLSRFQPEVAAYVKSQQYQRQSFEVDLYPAAGQFKVEKGKEIGRMGVSGRSFGPHLHFEIRDSGTEKPINPLLFGFKVADRVAPKMHALKIYYLNDKRETAQTKSFNLYKGGKTYRISKDTLKIGAWRAGFGVKTYDHMDKVSNWNGVYSLDMYVDDQLSYSWKMESFSFDETRYINAHLDYAEQVAKKSYYNRCYQLPGNQLSIYEQALNGGVVELSAHVAKEIRVVVGDVAGNESTLIFYAKRAEVDQPDAQVYNYFLPYDEENIVQTSNFKVHFPKGTFYENVYLKYNQSQERSAGVYSATHHIQDFKTPVHQYFDVSIRASQLSEELKEKAFIAFCGPKNKITNCGGSWDGDLLTSSVRDMGDYCVMLDTEPPTIKPIKFARNMRGYNRMSFKVKDNFKTARNMENFFFKATIDGQWILMEYDSKNDLITHRFDDRTPSGEHLFTLTVTDHNGNSRIFERTIVR